MDNLWAPWRIKYVVGEREPGCFLCVKSGQADDEKNLVLIRERNCFAILNAFPYNPGHLMVSPYKHTGELDDLAEQELSEMMLLTRRCQQILKRALQPDGFNVGINFGRVAGAGVLDHVHIHIVPRWNGDVNFMPVTGETRVIPQALAETHAKLRQHV